MTATVAGIHLGPDTHANLPTANTVPDGSLYSCSTHGKIYRSDFGGNTWDDWATLGAAASVFTGVKVYHSTTQAINNAAFTFDSEDYDDDGFHAGGTPTRLTVPSGKDGTYLAVGHFYTGAATERAVSLRLNGSTLIRGSYSAAQFGGVTVAHVELVATDYIEMFTTENATFGHATNPERQNSLSLALLH